MTDTDDRPRRRLSAAERRDELLTAASEVFGRAGYHGASLEEIAQTAGVEGSKVNYVPFSGGGEALAAIMGGHVVAGISGYSEWAGQIKSGELRALAISAPERQPVA